MKTTTGELRAEDVWALPVHPGDAAANVLDELYRRVSELERNGGLGVSGTIDFVYDMVDAAPLSGLEALLFSVDLDHLNGPVVISMLTATLHNDLLNGRVANSRVNR